MVTRSHLAFWGAAGTAVRPVLEGPPALFRVLGSSAHAAWLVAGPEVVMIACAGSVRLPNSVVVADTGACSRLARASRGPAARVGAGRLELAGMTVRVGRWFDSRPALPRTSRPALGVRLGGCRAPAVADRGLGRALRCGDGAGAASIALDLLGRGEGLTPLGDDVIAGALAGLLLLGNAAGTGPFRLFEEVAGPVLAAAPARTTLFSAALLAHAATGEVAAPVGRLLLALAGRGDPGRSLEALLAVGHTSGRGLASGVLAGAAAVARGVA